LRQAGGEQRRPPSPRPGAPRQPSVCIRRRLPFAHQPAEIASAAKKCSCFGEQGIHPRTSGLNGGGAGAGLGPMRGPLLSGVKAAARGRRRPKVGKYYMLERLSDIKRPSAPQPSAAAQAQPRPTLRPPNRELGQPLAPQPPPANAPPPPSPHQKQNLLVSSSPFWCIEMRMSQPPTKSPLK